MLRRIAVTVLAVLACHAGRADAVTVRDVIELSRAGLSEQVLLALIEVDRNVFTIDTATLKQLKQAGVSDPVIVAMIKSGRTPLQEPTPLPVAVPAHEPAPRQEPEVIVIEHRDAPVAVPYPVAVPVYVTSPSYPTSHRNTVTETVETDHGLVRARVPLPPNCTSAQPVYWGFGGKLRPDSWQPAPTVLCR